MDSTLSSTDAVAAALAETLGVDVEVAFMEAFFDALADDSGSGPGGPGGGGEASSLWGAGGSGVGGSGPGAGASSCSGAGGGGGTSSFPSALTAATLPCTLAVALDSLETLAVSFSWRSSAWPMGTEVRPEGSTRRVKKDVHVPPSSPG